MPVPLTVRIRRYRVQLIFIAVFFIFLFQYHKSSNFAPVTFPNEPPQQPIVHNVPVAEQEAVLPNKQLPKLNKEQDDISLDRTRPKKVAPKILEAPDVPFEEDVGVAGAAAEAATAAIAASKNEKPSSENTITNDNQPLKFPPSLGGGTITGNINIDRLNNANPNDINPKGKSSLPQLPSADDPLAPKYTPGDNIVYLPSNRHSTIRAIDRVLEPTYEDWITLEIIGTGNTNTRLDGIGGSFRPKVSKLPRSQNFPPSSIISLPSGGTTLPQIQATTFYTQSDSDRTERLRRLERAKEVFRIAWNQYRTHAWGYDEIKPVSQVAFNPFAGWAATLVDALDTMQIMGLTTEFQEAIELLKTIDFSSTFRIDIPLFETVIRYLGGLLSAYDLSNQSEKVLLDKAIQLADNLMGAFDTPNRFPRLHFKWEDTQQKYKERAGSSSNLAEFGSLSVEFTRLAQLTGNNTYYDAVDRLTQALARKAPGLSKPYLFPPGLDTSGCNLVPLDSNSESNAQKSQRNLPLAGETVVDAAESSASSSAVADGSISTIPLSLLSSNSITLSSSSTTISSPSSSFSSSSATQTTTPSATSTSTTSIPTSLSTTLTTPTSSSTSSNAVTSPTTSAGFSDSAASTSSPNIFQNQATVITQTQTPTTVAVSTVSPSTSFSVQNSASTISQVASENTVSVDSIVLVQNDPTAVTATLTQTSPGANAFFSSANNQNYIANNVYNGGNAVTPSLISVVSSNSLATGQIFIANPTPTFNINNVPTTVVLFNREEDSAGDDDESNAEDNSNKGVALERRQLGYTFQASTKVSVSGPGAVSVAAAAAAVVGGNNNGQARVYTKTVYASTPKAASTQASDVGSSAGSQAGLSGSQAGSLAGSFSGSNGFQAGSNAFSGNGFAQAFAQAGNAVAVANVNLNSPAVAFVAPTMVSSVQTLTHPSVQVQVNSGTQSAQVQSVSTTINQSPTVQSPYTITTTVKAPVQSQSPYTITTVIKASPSQETQEIQRSTQSTADVSLTSTLTSTFSSDASGSVQVQVGAQAGTSVAGQGSTQVQDFTSVEANGANIEVEATTSAQAGNVGTTTSAQGARQTTFYIASSASAFQSSPNSASVNAVGSVSTSIGDVGTSNYDTANDSDAISNDDSTTTGSLFDFSAYANKFDLSKMSLNSKFPFIKIRNSEAESSSFAKRGVIVPEIAQAESADNIEKRQSSSTTTSDGLQKVIAVYTGGQAVLTGCQSQDLVAKDSQNGSTLSMSGGTDSAYEYYLKEYILLNGADDSLRTLYTNTIDAANDNLVYKPMVEGDPDILFMGAVVNRENGFYQFDAQMSHLTCFVGGMYAMGSKIFNRPDDLEIARKLTQGCVWAYNSTRTGIMPESFTARRCPSSSSTCHFDFDTVDEVVQEDSTNILNSLHQQGISTESYDAYSFMTKPNVSVISDGNGGTRWPVDGNYDQPKSFIRMDCRYVLRPEALESVFYMYRITGEKIWQDQGWQMFESIVNASKIESGSGSIQGYSGISDVSDDRPLSQQPDKYLDSAESFWWAETLKYAYLLFADPDVISLDDYVLNTEAHPLRRRTA